MAHADPPKKRPVWPGCWVIAVCISVAGAAAVLLAAGCARSGSPPLARPVNTPGQNANALSELIVWVVGGDRNGIAVALNDLRRSASHAIAITRDDTKERTDLHAVVRDLIDDKHVRQMYPFSMTISSDTQDPEHDPSAPTLRFRFAKEGSLSQAWRPLYECAGNDKDQISLDTLAARYPDPGPALPDDKRRSPDSDAKQPAKPTSPGWLADLKWRIDLHDDLQASGMRRRVVILGPGTSDEVPALWFLLKILQRQENIVASKLPPMISTSATWTELQDAKRVTITTPGNEFALSPWVITLSRALGFSADQYHFQFARPEDADAMRRATHAVSPIAPWFIQYARPDGELVEEIHHQLVGVRGYRRIAILYRDSLTEGAGQSSPKLARRLYGPAISDEFRKWNPKGSTNLYFDSPFPKAPERQDDPRAYEEHIPVWAQQSAQTLKPSIAQAPPSRSDLPTYETNFANWQQQTGQALKPILRFFEREQVEAVGVFGNSADERAAVLKIVRKEIPNVQLFTAEPDWRLESPDPPGGEIIQIPVGTRPKASEYPLDGLMVFAGSVPDRDWVRVRFQELNELAFLGGDGEAFLPNVSDFFTAHVVKRLIDLTRKRDFSLLQKDKIKSSADHPPGRNRRGDHYLCALESAATGPCSLECFLREQSNVGTPEIQREELSASGSGDSILMLISNGRLRPINEPGWADGRLGIVLGLLIMVIGLLWFFRSDRRANGARRPSAGAPTLWTWLVHGRVKPTPALAQPQAQLDSSSLSGSGPAPPTQPASEGARYVVGWRPKVAAIIGLVVLLLPLAAVQLDMEFFKLQVSPSLVPDAHSILPSLFLFILVTVLAIRLPDEFRQEIEGHGRLDRRRGDGADGDYEWWLKNYELPENPADEAAFDRILRRWKRHSVDAHLIPDWVGWAVSMLLALVLTVIDGFVVGLPVPMGFTWWLSFVFEFIMFTMVIATTLIFADMARAVHRLRLPETFGEDETLDKFLRMMDPESVRRLGSVFIDVVANGLLIFTLLLVARLPWLGMARWRWDLPVFNIFLLLGPILFSVAFMFILGYWYYCHRTFRILIQRIKDAKLQRLRAERQEALRTASQSAVEPGSPPSTERTQDGRFETRRKAILSIPEEPWSPTGARKAQVALLTALATPIVSVFLGPWSAVLKKAIDSVFGA